MSDARVPVVRGEAPLAGDAVLLSRGAAAPAGHAAAWLEGHVAGCACCGGARGAAGRALGRLFLARARGEVGFFGRVVAAVTEGEWAEVRAAVEGGDVMAAARFRMG